MYYFIINPKSSSGKGMKFWWIVKDELDKNHISYSSSFTKYPGHATELAKKFVMLPKELKYYCFRWRWNFKRSDKWNR